MIMRRVARRLAIAAAGVVTTLAGGTYAVKRTLEAEFPVSVDAVLAGRPCLDEEHVKTCVLPPIITESGKPRHRTISYREFGSPHAAKTVIVLHAPGSSRLQLACSGGEPLDFSLKRDVLPPGWQPGDESPAERLGIRVIAIDRPGYGNSTDDAPVAPENLLQDVAMLVRDVATELGLKEYGVVGLGGAGAYALACARYLPQELSEFAPDAPTLRGVSVVSLEGPWRWDESSVGAEVSAMRGKAEKMNEMQGVSGKAMAGLCKDMPWVADIALMIILRLLTKNPDAAAVKLLEAMDKECGVDAKTLRAVFARSRPATGASNAAAFRNDISGLDPRGEAEASPSSGDSGQGALATPAADSECQVPADMEGVGVLGADMFEGVRGGLAGIKQDALALGGKAWGFSLAEVNDDPMGPSSQYGTFDDAEGSGPAPFVSLWCGDADTMVSPDWTVAAHREGTGPGAVAGAVELRRVPGAGHVGLVADHWADILERLGERL